MEHLRKQHLYFCALFSLAFALKTIFSHNIVPAWPEAIIGKPLEMTSKMPVIIQHYMGQSKQASINCIIGRYYCCTCPT